MRAGLAATAVFIVDQASKAWVLSAYDLKAVGRVEALSFLNFVYALNTGINFGFGASDSVLQQYVLAGVAVAASIALMIWAARTHRPFVPLGCGLVAGGALANGLDRLHAGGVIDFINLDCCGIGNPFAFNVADVGIFVGAILIAWFAWSDEKQAEAPPRTTDSAP
ncbi:MAG: signal peptidase II [Neomegalonema sp.]|nr:signal peptidase II [Neomegalonema sp.]